MIKIIFFLIPLALFATPDLYKEGKKLYFSKGCSGCHGVSATGSNQYPSLAYRRKPFLIHRLKGFRDKQVSSQLSEMMIPFALTLKDNEIDALTTFLSEFHESGSSYKSEYNTKGDGGS